MNLVDLIINDHQSMRDCLDELRKENGNVREKFICAKEFLNTLQSHLEAEENILYKNVLRFPLLRKKILKAAEEHDLIHSRLRELIPRLFRLRQLNEDLEARMMVLAEVVDRHFMEEERKVLPLLERLLSQEEMRKWTDEFISARKLSGERRYSLPANSRGADEKRIET